MIWRWITSCEEYDDLFEGSGGAFEGGDESSAIRFERRASRCS